MRALLQKCVYLPMTVQVHNPIVIDKGCVSATRLDNRQYSLILCVSVHVNNITRTLTLSGILLYCNWPLALLPMEVTAHCYLLLSCAWLWLKEAAHLCLRQVRSSLWAGHTAAHLGPLEVTGENNTPVFHKDLVQWNYTKASVARWKKKKKKRTQNIQYNRKLNNWKSLREAKNSNRSDRDGADVCWGRRGRSWGQIEWSSRNVGQHCGRSCHDSDILSTLLPTEQQHRDGHILNQQWQGAASALAALRHTPPPLCAHVPPAVVFRLFICFCLFLSL